MGFIVLNTNVNKSYSQGNAAVTTASTTMVFSGVSINIVPYLTGRIHITANLDISNNTLGDGVAVQLYYGTGVSGGTLGASVSGTAVGQLESYTQEGVASNPHNVSIIADLTGLTIGTQYWIEPAIKAITGGTVNVAVNYLGAEEW